MSNQGFLQIVLALPEYESLRFCAGRGYAGDIFTYAEVDEREREVFLTFQGESDALNWASSIDPYVFGACMPASLLRKLNVAREKIV